MATTKETKILYCGGIVTCDENNRSKYKHGNDSQAYRNEFASLFIDGNTNDVITSATNPTDADAYILERELDGGTVRSETLHVFESKCSPRMKCKYRRQSSTTQTIKLINGNTPVWSKDIDEGKMTVMVHYNDGERLKNTYEFPTTAKTDVTVTYDFVEGNLFPNQTTAAMFNGCYSLVECELPCEMRVISNNTFKNCGNLTSYTKSPEFIESIGTSAFQNCTSLKEILIPEFASISTSSFAGCNGASALTWNNLVCTMSNGGEITTTNVKCNMTSVPDKAFEGCSDITKTKLKNSVGDDVVYDGLVIPMGITKVGIRAFAENSIYSKLWMGKVDTIDSAAFQGNTSLTKIIGLSNVTKIEDSPTGETSGAFEGCISLSTIDGFNVNKYVYIGDRAFYGCTELTNINSTSMVNHLGVSSFEGCTSLTWFDFSSVSTIPNRAFYGCTNLVNADNTSDVNQLGVSSFEGCTSLTSFDFSSVSTVPESCFKSTSLVNAYNTSNITEVGKYAFQYTDLASLDSSDWSSLGIIGEGAFSHCTGLTSVSLTSSDVQTLDMGSNAFGTCSSLTSITFDGYSKINATYGAFSNTNNVYDITFKNDTKITLNMDECFYDIPTTADADKRINVTIISNEVCTTLYNAFSPTQYLNIYLSNFNNLVQLYISEYGGDWNQYIDWRPLTTTP